MRTRLKITLTLSALFLLCSFPASAQVTVSGNVQDVGLANVTSGMAVTFELQNYHGEIPRISGGAVLGRVLKTFKTDASGNFTGSLYPNSVITPGDTFYRACVVDRGQNLRCNNYLITGNFDLGSATPISSEPVSPSKIFGYRTYLFTAASPLSVWTINHNLGDPNVDVYCFDLTGVTFNADMVTRVSTQQVIVNFNAPTTGKCNVASFGNSVLTTVIGDAVVQNPNAGQTVNGSYPFTFQGPVNVQGLLTSNGGQVHNATETFTADALFKSGRPWFDVIAFGADPTGATCSSTQIGNAMTAATVAGGIVFFPPGKFKGNVTVATGVTLRGTSARGMFPGSGNSVTPSQLITCVAGTSPVITTQADGSGVIRTKIEGLTIIGNGTGVSDIGLSIPSGAGTVEVTDSTFITFGQQAILQNASANAILTIDRIVVGAALNDRTSAVRRGAIEIHAPNVQMTNVETGAGVVGGSTITNAALNNCALLIDGGYGNYTNVMAELAEAGICLTANGNLNTFNGVNANLVAGHGWICTGCSNNQGSAVIASNFGQATASTYDGFNFSATSNGNNFTNAQSVINGGLLAARYGINDVSTAYPGNTWNQPFATGTHTAPVVLANGGNSSADYPNNFFFVVDGTGTIDVSQKKILQFGQSTPLTLTGFTNTFHTQQLVLLGNANVSLPNNASIKTASGATLQLEANKTYRFTNIGGVLYQDGSERDLTLNTLKMNATVFASLGTPVNGSIIYCSDCTIANPCAALGTGALAKRLAGVWVCN